MKNLHVIGKELFITSDEKLPYDDSIFDTGAFYHKDASGTVHIITKNTFKPNPNFCKRIILTTDQDLIDDGVQSIDNEFLEWFVNNPSCEEVEVKINYSNSVMNYSYKIIIPKEEPVAICGTLGFLVHPTELGEMTWKEAKKACASLGKGWRLPTRVELLLMYENKDVVGGFAVLYYWSSTEGDNFFAWWQNFSNGSQSSNNKTNTNYVRAVKTI